MLAEYVDEAERSSILITTIGDEGDKLVAKVNGCTLRSEDGGNPIPIWHEQVLKLPEMREELRKIREESVLDMSFEEEVVRELEETFGKGKAYYTIDAETLRADNENLQCLGKILTMLTDCMDKVKQTKGWPLFIQFYIPR